MAHDAPVEIVKVTVQGRAIVLDPNNMKYNENSLGEYMGKEYGWVDYLGKQLEYAQKEVLHAEIESEKIYSKKFIESKDMGNSDNYAKAYALQHDDVVAAKKFIADRKETVGHIKAHLKAFDKNHENVQNRGHTLRKELDKLNRDIYSPTEEDLTCIFEDAIKEKECP
jgi:hypothetical protein